MIFGLLLAMAAALIYGFLGVCYEFAAKRQYPIWHVGLLMQVTGLVIGLIFTASVGTPYADRRLFVSGLWWAVFIGLMTFLYAYVIWFQFRGPGAGQ